MTPFDLPEFRSPQCYGDILALGRLFRFGPDGSPEMPEGNLTRIQEFVLFRRYNFYRYTGDDALALADRNHIAVVFMRAAQRCANEVVQRSRGAVQFDEALSEVCLFMLRAIELFDYRLGYIRFSTFLLNGVRFVWLSMRRKHFNISEVSFMGDVDEIVSTTQRRPDTIVIEKEGVETLLMLLDRAPPMHKEIAREFWWHGRTGREIAVRQGVSRSTVYKRKREMLTWLRTYMRA